MISKTSTWRGCIEEHESNLPNLDLTPTLATLLFLLSCLKMDTMYTEL